jgi:mannose-6-phosphate isomerase-like protein (cupin superfamily)
MTQLPALLIKLESVKRDAALEPGNRGARKIVVTELYPAKESEADNVEWNPPINSGKCPVQVTNNIEVAVFTHSVPQDRHLHKVGTEMYMVLEGEMKIEVEGQDYTLFAGDMIVVNPGAAHEVKQNGTEFICRVVTANCGGNADKYPAA